MIRTSQKGTDLSDLSQMAAVSLETMAADLDQSSAPGISTYPTPALNVPLALSVHQVQGIGQEGATIWNPTVTVYSWNNSTGTLQSLRCPPAPAALTPLPSQTQPYHWTVPNLQTLLGSGPAFTLLATNVSSWSVAGLSNQGMTPPVVLTLTLSRTTNNQIQTFTLSQSVTPAVHNEY
jgi:hypothetical protein